MFTSYQRCYVEQVFLYGADNINFIDWIWGLKEVVHIEGLIQQPTGTSTQCIFIVFSPFGIFLQLPTLFAAE